MKAKQLGLGVILTLAMASCANKNSEETSSVESSGAYQLGVLNQGIVKIPAGANVPLDLKLSGGTLVQSPLLPTGFGATVTYSGGPVSLSSKGVNSTKNGVEYLKIGSQTGQLMLSAPVGSDAFIGEITLKANIYPFSSAVVRTWIQIIPSPIIPNPISNLTTHLDTSVSTTFKVIGTSPESIKPPLTKANFAVTASGGDTTLFDSYDVSCVTDPTDAKKKTLDCKITITPKLSAMYGKTSNNVQLSLTVTDRSGGKSKPSTFSLTSTNSAPKFVNPNDQLMTMEYNGTLKYPDVSDYSDPDNDKVKIVSVLSSYNDGSVMICPGNSLISTKTNNDQTLESSLLLKDYKARFQGPCYPRVTVVIEDAGKLQATTSFNVNFRPVITIARAAGDASDFKVTQVVVLNPNPVVTRTLLANDINGNQTLSSFSFTDETDPSGSRALPFFLANRGNVTVNLKSGEDLGFLKDKGYLDVQLIPANKAPYETVTKGLFVNFVDEKGAMTVIPAVINVQIQGTL